MVNRAQGASRLLSVLRAQLGKPYSQQSPQGSDGDGHLWAPGEPWPDFFDCSGLVYTGFTAVDQGATPLIDISDGNADDQWGQSAGGRVAVDDPLAPGDVGSFLGAEDTPGYAGHTGIVESYDPASRTLTLLNAYDTQLGVCRIPNVARDNATDNSQGLAVLGFYRPLSLLPAAPAPVPSGTPTAAQCAARLVEELPTPADVAQATENGWTLFCWCSTRFLPWPADEDYPAATPVYANRSWRKKRPRIVKT